MFKSKTATLEYQREYRKQNPDKLLEYQRKHRKAHPEGFRKQALKRYGITLEEYDTMFSQQGGLCAMCGKPDSSGRRLAVDHSHATGRVRSLLCLNCNTSLGCFEKHRENILRYLEIHDGPI